VAANALGWEVGYDNKEGVSLREMRKGRGRMVQPPAAAVAIPASSSHLFKVSYSRKEVGRGNLLVNATQKIGTIGTITGSGTNEALVLAGTTRQATLGISPDIIGGQIALDARNYSFYRFQKIRFIFVMNAPSTDSLGVAVAYEPDSAIADFQTVTVETIAQTTDYMQFTRKQMGPVIWDLTKLKATEFKKFATEVDTTSSSSKRMTIQGVCYFYYTASDTATTTVYGDVLMEYQLSLYNRAPDYGFTISIPDRLFARLIWEKVEEYLNEMLRARHQKWARDRLGIDEKSLPLIDVATETNRDWAVERLQTIQRYVNRYNSTKRAAALLRDPFPITAPKARVFPQVCAITDAVYYDLGGVKDVNTNTAAIGAVVNPLSLGTNYTNLGLSAVVQNQSGSHAYIKVGGSTSGGREVMVEMTENGSSAKGKFQETSLDVKEPLPETAVVVEARKDEEILQTMVRAGEQANAILKNVKKCDDVPRKGAATAAPK